MPRPDIRLLPHATGVVRTAEDLVRRACQEAVRRNGRFVLALAGGATPVPLYQRLTLPGVPEMNWEQTIVLFGDERCVPPDHPDSNYGMAKRTLLDKVGVRPDNILRIPGELDARRARKAYEDVLERRLGPMSSGRIDLVLLGVGADGHVASLFPGHHALRPSPDWTDMSFAPSMAPDHDRVTLTLDAINGAEAAVLLVVGANKARAVRDALREPMFGPPAGMVRARTRTIWLIDPEAASLLDARGEPMDDPQDSNG